MGSGFRDAWDIIDPYLEFAVTIAGFVAVYVLGVYYYVIKSHLAAHNVLGKLLSIKFVIFMTFWQGIALQILQYTGVIHTFRFGFIEFRAYSSQTIAGEVQNCLICLEMFAISVVHWWTFPVTPYQGVADRPTVRPGFGDVVGYQDTYDDLRLLWRLDPKLGTIMNIPKGGNQELPNVAESLLSGEDPLALPGTIHYGSSPEYNYTPLPPEKDLPEPTSPPATMTNIHYTTAAPSAPPEDAAATGTFPGVRR